MRNALAFLSVLFLGFNSMAYSTQTIVFVRHGEKPNNDSGQLTCKGLNRALALPDVLISQFGKPDALFASAPKQNKLGSSLRAVQTITPTAIRESLPINQNYHAKETKELQKALLSSEYANSVIFITWEHDNLVKAAKGIMKSEGGDPGEIPKWQGSDFDSIYVLRTNRDNGSKTITFEHMQQGLNGVSEQCPE
ncbi:histidine phosphatase family protein [Providencia alcalifaciens]|uniref:histidine phosphatase family protein n=1 Tax=Providencia alcalifaciens TaxID=126385 RepID=UPI002B06224E|nr:histidine phosphatase family protein [Providencia alcalifaciens]